MLSAGHHFRCLSIIFVENDDLDLMTFDLFVYLKRKW